MSIWERFKIMVFFFHAKKGGKQLGHECCMNQLPAGLGNWFEGVMLEVDGLWEVFAVRVCGKSLRV